MSDFAITRVDGQIPDDTTWAASRHGFDTAGTGTLDVTKFVKADHFPNGYIPSGTPVVKGDDGKYGPLSAGDAEAEPPVAGVTEYDAVVLAAVPVREGQEVAVFAALDEGIVYGDKLRGSVEGATPAGNGIVQR